MTSISSIARSGMQAAQTALNSSAHNVANVNTEGFRRQQVSQSALADGGVSTIIAKSSHAGPDLQADLVAQLQAKNAFLANLKVFKTSDAMAGALLDTKG